MARDLLATIRRGLRAILPFATLACSLTISSRATAAEVKIPLTIDYVALTEALRTQVYNGSDGRAQFWNGIDACQYFYAENPQFGRAGDALKLESSGHLSMGIAVAGKCVSPIAWQGIMETESTPYIANGTALRLKVRDINLYDPNHQKTLIAGKGFDQIKQYVIPQLETFNYDLKPAVQQLGALAEAASQPQVADRVRAAIDTLHAEPQVTPLDDGIRVTLVLTVPDVELPPASPVAATPEEIQAFQAQLDQWDAFLVFAMKQLGETVGDQQFRQQLLQILLDSRYRLVRALANPPSASGPDPVRTVFLDEWQKLADTVRAAARRGALGSRALQFASFISAGDALFALDQAAPALGLRVSADDLRRLAHIMAPQAAGDPLQFDYNEDPELRRLFKPNEPLSSPSALEGAEPESGDTPPASVSTAGGTAPAELPPSKVAPEAPEGSPTSWLWKPSSWFASEEAFAAQSSPAVGTPALPHTSAVSFVETQLRNAAKLLRRAVPDPGNITAYRTDMQTLLDLSATRQLSESDMSPHYRPTFKSLVRSAAWQESCWRQFVNANGRVRWLESSTGDLGLMQVNKHVWRGFYDLQRLRWDVLYNAGAGCEILSDLMQASIARANAASAKSDSEASATNIARSAYAAYNGGPGAAGRWRRRDEPEPARSIDAAFYQKFETVQHGHFFDILTCASEWGATPGH